MTEPVTQKSSQSQLLWQLVQDMAEIKATIKTVQDHEDRIRDLEKARYQSAIIISIATAVLSSAAVAIILKVIV